MSGYNTYYSAIKEIYDCLHRDLIGPVEEFEVLENLEPLNTYACGILWPMRMDSSPSESDEPEEALILTQQDDSEELEDTVVVANDSISNANVYTPSSMGISIVLPSSVSQIDVTFSFAKYSHKEERIGEKRVIHRYVRSPLSVSTPAKIGVRLGTNQLIHDNKLGIELTLTIRNILDKGSKLVTITAQNISRARQKSIDQNISALFQCELTISSNAALLPIYQNNALISDIEEQISRLQYRNVVNYAYGHGCSIAYEETFKGVFAVKSNFLPTEQVYQMMPGEINNDRILNLAYWKTVSFDEAYTELTQFVNEYKTWFDHQKKQAVLFELTELQLASEQVFERINECVARLLQGIESLKNNANAWQAFLLMNRAMLLQRIKTKHIDEKTINWYPFQIAYILQIIPDIVDEKSKYRENVDLLWFPTGGGKTEAYLGVAAFTIFYRRLTGGTVADGVTVIMRYTLRLLTIQQFERAIALICACEHIRRNENILGGEINIGLWIGSSMTPNRVARAKEALQKLRDNPREELVEGNPVQITKCPWCGKKIDLNGYAIKGGTMTISCADNSTCEFHKGLPIYVIDDDIYRVRPTLLLSTIDKFARIAWEENTGNLFGGKCPPPELIIQDELHLVSGPLGSLAGVYEIALEYLCGKAGKLPKIIASTATVKNAQEQIRNLYARRTIQFPPAGINYDDSFFAVRADADQRPARTYIGLCEMGGSITDLLIRVYGTLFFTKAMFRKQGKDTDVIDQYFTTIGYFNALRDLGASSTIIQDRIYTHIRNLIARTFQKESEQYKITPADASLFEHSELTSRKSAKEIKDTLDRLAIRYDAQGSYSYVLSSNMLSVGIDIDRLGVMTVYSQPKSNSEYIQATSRVGRRNPGVVLAMYNNMRSRDKSHYEQFGYYHKSFYRYVEATSVTPFSVRAMEKALHCIFVALIRLTIPELSANESARYFQADSADVIKIQKYILQRVGEIMPKNIISAEEMLIAFAEDWAEVASENSNTLCYKSYTGSPSLLSSAEEDSELGLPKILNSLRNVDPVVNIYFKR